MVIPGQTLTVHVPFTADIDSYFCNQFFFYANDPTLGTGHHHSPGTNPLAGHHASLSLNLNFPLTAVGSSSSQDIEIGNTGQEMLWSPEFNVATPLPLLVAPGETGALRAVFTLHAGWILR